MTGLSGVRTHARKTLNEIGDAFFWTSSRKEIRTLLERFPEGDPSSIYGVMAAYRGRGWYRRTGATQIESEFRALIDDVRLLRPRVILEIGTARGGSFLAWSRNASETVISVDLPGGIHGGGYVAERQRLYEEFAWGRPGVDLVLLRKDSHRESTVDRVKTILGSRVIDFLFIDGDHTLAGVSRDFEIWSPLVRSGGAVAFHDIVRHPEFDSIDVHLFWAGVRDQYRTREFIADPQGGFGIGLLFVDAGAGHRGETESETVRSEVEIA